MAPRRPRRLGVLETALYYAPGQAEAMETFYRDVLGLRLVRRWPAGMAFRARNGLVLLFDRSQTATQRLPHGASGQAHTCLVASASDYAAWKEQLAARGVETLDETTWSSGACSFYFGDPAGNLLEIAERDLWPS
jgi:catechol 2,3-dioxygenase-like lactoylglutathione lyase family enzyme